MISSLEWATLKKHQTTKNSHRESPCEIPLMSGISAFSKDVDLGVPYGNLT